MDDERQMTRLLTRAADSAGHFAPVPVDELVPQRTHRLHAPRLTMRPLLAVAATVAVIAGLGVGLSVVGHDTKTKQHPAAAGPGSAAQLLKDHWKSLPPAPIPTTRIDHAQWTGKELLVLGDDGKSASYDPVKRQWTVLPAGEPRLSYGTISSWDGHSLYVWSTNGAQDGYVHAGGRYDVADNSWHAVPPPAIDTAGDAVAIAVDHKVVVFGVSYGATSTVHATTLNNGKWSRLPDLHGPAGRVTSVNALRADANALVSVGTGRMQVKPHFVVTTGQQLYSFSPAKRQWTKLPVTPITHATSADMLYLSDQLVLPESYTNADDGWIADAIDPRTGRHTYIPAWVVPGTKVTVNPDGSTGAVIATANYVWTGHALIGLSADPSWPAAGHAGAAVWQPGAKHWKVLPSTKRPGATPVWAGDRLIVLCHAAPGCRGQELAP